MGYSRGGSLLLLFMLMGALLMTSSQDVMINHPMALAVSEMVEWANLNPAPQDLVRAVSSRLSCACVRFRFRQPLLFNRVVLI